MLPSIRSCLLVGLATVYVVAGQDIKSLPSRSSLDLAGPASSPSAQMVGASVCNNSPLLCSRAYNTITYMGAHDSAFLRDAQTENSLAGNQFYNATDALSAGLRLLQTQVHLSDGQLRLCHTLCLLLDAGPLQDWLEAINYWMLANPTDVVTLLLVNSNAAAIEAFGKAFTASGLSTLAYTQPSSSATWNWPTLQSMINAGTRLVVFVTPIQPSTQYPYLLSEFEYVFETAYEVSSGSGFNCSLDRPGNLGSYALSDNGATAATQANYLGLVNHMLDVVIAGAIYLPDAMDLNVTNSPDPSVQGSVAQHIQLCQSRWGDQPSFVLVDFWNRGKALQAADAINGLTPQLITGRSSDMLHSNLQINGNEQSGAVKLHLMPLVAAGAVLMATAYRLLANPFN